MKTLWKAEIGFVIALTAERILLNIFEILKNLPRNRGFFYYIEIDKCQPVQTQLLFAIGSNFTNVGEKTRDFVDVALGPDDDIVYFVYI